MRYLLLPAVSLFAVVLALQESLNEGSIPMDGQAAGAQGPGAPLPEVASASSSDSVRSDIQSLPGDVVNLLPITGHANPLHVYGPADLQQEHSGTSDPPPQQQGNQAPAEPAIQPAEPYRANDPPPSQQKANEQNVQPLIQQTVADTPSQQAQQPQAQAQQPQAQAQQPQVAQQIEAPQPAQTPPEQQAQPPVHDQETPVVGQAADKPAQRDAPPAQRDAPPAQPPFDLSIHQASITTTGSVPMSTYEPTATVPTPTTIPTAIPTTPPSLSTRVSTFTRTVTATPMPTHNAAPTFSYPKALIAMTVASLVVVAL